jgi:hypothetical protein
VGVGREYLPLEGGDQRLESVAVGDLVKVKLTVVAPSDLRFVAVEDFLPAGLEPIDGSLKTTSFELREILFEEERRIAEERRCQQLLVNPFDHVETHDNRVVLFATSMPKGVYEYVYLARATTPGQFHVPPAHAYETYFPEVQGRTDGGTFEVRQ